MIGTATAAAPAQAGYCTQFAEGTKATWNWIAEGSKNAASKAGDTISRVWESVKTFFSNLGENIGLAAKAAKEGLCAGSAQLMALPKEAKVLLGVGTGLVALVTALACKCWNKPAETTQAASTTATATNAAAAGAAAPAASTTAPAPAANATAPAPAASTTAPAPAAAPAANATA